MDTATPEEHDTLESTRASNAGFAVFTPSDSKNRVTLQNAYGFRIVLDGDLSEAAARLNAIREANPEAHCVEVSVEYNGEVKEMTYAEFFARLGFKPEE